MGDVLLFKDEKFSRGDPTQVRKAGKAPFLSAVSTDLNIYP